eukprot:CFRG7925T1
MAVGNAAVAAGRRFSPSNATTNVPKEKLRSSNAKTLKVQRPNNLTSGLSSQFKHLSVAEFVDLARPEGSKMLFNLCEKQTLFLPNPQYMTRVQKGDIEEYMRRDIVEWMYKLNVHFDYLHETFAVAVNLFDRFLSMVKVKPLHLQLIAATSVLLAAKTQEAWNTYPAFNDLVPAGNFSFSACDLQKMEKLIITKLSWNLNPITPHVVIHQLMRFVNVRSEEARAKIITEAENMVNSCLLESHFLIFRPSTLAACAVMMAMSEIGEACATDKDLRQILFLTSTKHEVFNQCSDDLKRLQINVTPAL